MSSEREAGYNVGEPAFDMAHVSVMLLKEGRFVSISDVDGRTVQLEMKSIPRNLSAHARWNENQAMEAPGFRGIILSLARNYLSDTSRERNFTAQAEYVDVKGLRSGTRLRKGAVTIVRHSACRQVTNKLQHQTLDDQPPVLPIQPAPSMQLEVFDQEKRRLLQTVLICRSKG